MTRGGTAVPTAVTVQLWVECGLDQNCCRRRGGRLRFWRASARFRASKCLRPHGSYCNLYPSIHIRCHLFRSPHPQMADSAAHVAEWSIVTTTGRGVLPSPRCGHSLSLTGAGDSGSRHLIVAFGETVRAATAVGRLLALCCCLCFTHGAAVLLLCCAEFGLARAIVSNRDLHPCLRAYTCPLLNGVGLCQPYCFFPLNHDIYIFLIHFSACGQTKTKERKFFNDVYGLSNGREWNILNVTGRVPVLPRSNHSATVFGDDLNSIFFFGGTSLHSFLDDSLVLTGIGSGTPARSSHRMTQK